MARRERKTTCRCTHKRTVTGNRCGDCGLSLAPVGPPLQDGDKKWDTPCEACGQKPTVHPTDLCGPCCFGEAATFGGEW